MGASVLEFKQMATRTIKRPKAKSITGPKRYSLVTKYLGERIDLKKAQDEFRRYEFLNHDHPLVLRIVNGKYVVLTKFGTVSFWNASEEDIERFVKEISPYAKGSREKYDYIDTLKIYVGAETEKTTFDELYIRNLDIEKIKIISYVSAQSVALDRYEEEIDRRLGELGRVAENLKTDGHTRFTEKSLLRQVGHVLSVKQSTVSSLSLFDKPDEAWEREEIEKLYNRLRSAYELHDRFDILNEKLNFLSENNITLLDFVTAAKNNFLELVIVVLIVVEIVILVLEIFKVIP